jgi:acyl-CoA thioesterase-2
MMLFDLRPTRPPGRDGFPLRHPFWVRTREAVDADPVVHACLLAFLSDMAVVSSARAPGSTVARFAGASLDHAMWFHRQARVDDWLLFSVGAVSNAGARGLALGTLHDRSGVLVASIAQEALLRPTGGAPRP